jgi:hypothetical protein
VTLGETRHMKSKDQQHLEEAYSKMQENKQRKDYFEDALKNPEKFELELDTIDTEDWDGDTVYTTIAYIAPLGAFALDYERIDNPDDIQSLTDAFEAKNPEGISDHRRNF